MAGRLVHFELPADDTARARDFWSSLFGWSFRGWDGPIEYLDLDDMDAAIGRVRELGGEADDKQPIPGIGWFARARDTEGNRFSLYQSDESAPGPSEG